MRLTSKTIEQKLDQVIVLLGKLASQERTNRRPSRLMRLKDAASYICVSPPVIDFRDAWHAVCVRSGVGKFLCLDCDHVVTKTKCDCGSRRRTYKGLLFHDLRRSGVRNLRRLGVAGSVAMKISGHKTASVFRRYDIIEQSDLDDAAAKLEAKQKSQTVPEVNFGQSLGRTAKNGTKSEAATDNPLRAAVLPN